MTGLRGRNWEDGLRTFKMDLAQLIPLLGVSIANVGFVVWGTYIKDPPLFVSWREHKAAVERGDKAIDTAAKLVDQNGQMLQLMKDK